MFDFLNLQVWGYTTMGVTVSLLSASFIPVYVWTIFTINLLLAIVTGEYRAS